MGDFETLRAAVAVDTVGGGIVARYPGVVCLAQGGPADRSHVRALLEICREASAGAAPGRPLAKRLAAWLSAADGPGGSLRFGTVSATGEDGLAVFCVGAVSMIAEEAGVTVRGTEAAAWADRLLARPDAPVLLVLDGVTVGSELASTEHDLRHGVVPGAAVALLSEGSPPPAAPVGVAPPVARLPAAPQDEPAVSGVSPTPEPTALATPLAAAQEQQPASAAPAPPSVGQTVLAPPPPHIPVAGEPPTQVLRDRHHPQATQLRAPRRSDPLDSGEATELRPPLPLRGPAEDPTSISTSQARGYLCKNNHLNDPRSHFCVLCGIRMNQQTGVLVFGTRPPLGLLVFDDGSAYTLDADYCVGRMPEVHPRVAEGGLRAIVLDDHTGAVSRAHAEIHVHDWDVVLSDSGSSNGTHVAAPGEESWTQLHPGEQRRLQPGTRVRLGGRTFVFESPGGLR